jgi:hypothetical protein
MKGFKDGKEIVKIVVFFIFSLIIIYAILQQKFKWLARNQQKRESGRRDFSIGQGKFKGQMCDLPFSRTVVGGRFRDADRAKR